MRCSGAHGRFLPVSLSHLSPNAVLVINQFLDVAEKDLGDLAVRAADFDRRLAERLGAAKVVYLASDASPVFRDHLDVIAVEHSLQVLHHSKKIFHHPILPHRSSPNQRPAKRSAASVVPGSSRLGGDTSSVTACTPLKTK